MFDRPCDGLNDDSQSMKYVGQISLRKEFHDAGMWFTYCPLPPTCSLPSLPVPPPPPPKPLPLPPLPAAIHHYLLPPHRYLLPPTATCCLPSLPTPSRQYSLPPTVTWRLSPLSAAFRDYLIPSTTASLRLSLMTLHPLSERCLRSESRIITIYSRSE